MIDVPAIKRFIKYASVGVSTFLFDLGLLFILIDLLGWNYAVATGGAFILAVAVNYLISRRYVFVGTKRDFFVGAFNFFTVAGIAMFVIVFAMIFCMEVLQWHYLISRMVVGALVGLFGYLFNLYINFKVVGLHFPSSQTQQTEE